jgi:hypothetical protein
MPILALVLFSIFIILAVIHFTWAFGGRWGFDKALPTKENGKKLLNPRNFDCAVVGLGLTGFAVYYLLVSNLFGIQIQSSIFNYIAWFIPSIFILRAIGDFKYVGFFKSLKKTDFGRLDTKLYSPLCLIIGIIGIVIQIIQ